MYHSEKQRICQESTLKNRQVLQKGRIQQIATTNEVLVVTDICKFLVATLRQRALGIAVVDLHVEHFRIGLLRTDNGAYLVTLIYAVTLPQ